MLTTYKKNNVPVFDKFFDDFFIRDFFVENNFFSPKYDIIDNENDYTIEFMLPGFKKEMINIDVDNDNLIISGERKFEEEKKYNYKSTEFGKFKKNFTLPKEVDSENISAKFEDGILYLVVPKDKEKKGIKSIQVK